MAGEVARIVLDSRTTAGRFHHLEVENRALLEALRLKQTSGAIELFEPVAQLILNAGDGLNKRGAGRDIV